MRRFVVALLLLPAVVLGGWLLSEQLPALLEPQWWWIGANGSGGAPAACEAASSLRLYSGERALFEQPTVSADAAKTAADQFIAAHYASGDAAEAAAPIDYSVPSLFRATLDGERRLVWLYTARIASSHVATLPGTDMPGAAVIVYLDANTGEALQGLSAAGASDAEAMCPFPLRDWAVAAARSTAFMTFAGYVGLLLVLGVFVTGWRLISRRRKNS